jgi:hypothetical protein
LATRTISRTITALALGMATSTSLGWCVSMIRDNSRRLAGARTQGLSLGDVCY